MAYIRISKVNLHSLEFMSSRIFGLWLCSSYFNSSLSNFITCSLRISETFAAWFFQSSLSYLNKWHNMKLHAGRNACENVSFEYLAILRIIERSCGLLVYAHRIANFGERREIPRRRKVVYVGTVMHSPHSRWNLYAIKLFRPELAETRPIQFTIFDNFQFILP